MDASKVFLLHNLQTMIMFYMEDPFEKSACRNHWRVYAFAPLNIVNVQSKVILFILHLLCFSSFVIQKWTIVENGMSSVRRKENPHMIVICKQDILSSGSCRPVVWKMYYSLCSLMQDLLVLH
jgi:hypothetical protein